MNRRNFLGNVAGTITMLTATTESALAAPRSPELHGDILSNVHAELRPLAAEIPRMIEAAAKDPEMAQRMMAEAVMPLADVPWKEQRIPGHGANPEVTVFVINARKDSARPAILHTHGGGFIGGKAVESLRPLQKLAKALDCVIVSVDYRLAPATNWQGSTEDNYAGLKWLHANAEALGADRSRIALLGDSAGGGHAALLGIRARDRGEVPVCFQCLVYPMLDDRTGSSRAVPSFIGRFVWTAENNKLGWQAFLGTEPGGKDVPVAAVPARAENLSGLPPTWIGVGAIDLFAEEDVEFARKLVNAGVPTELHMVPGAFHGFDTFPEWFGRSVSISDQFNAAKLNAFRRAFGQSVKI